MLSVVGDKRLDAITSEDVQRFKASRAHLSTKTINILATLNTIPSSILPTATRK